MKKLILFICCALLGIVCAKDYREDTAKYWDFKKLTKVPAYRPSGLAESKAEGLEDILFEGLPKKGKPAPVFAYIGYPKTPMPKGGYPGILLIHGGGGTAYPGYARLWTEKGFAVLMMDWYNGHPVKNAKEGRKVKSKLPLPGGIRNDIPLNVGNMVLAHSLLRSLPKVNKDKTAFVGLSWGSWYGATVAALDPRFKGVIEIYCGDVNLKKKHLVNGRFVHSAKVPMYWVCSTNDANVTFRSLQRAWDDCPNLVTKSLVIRLPHSHVGFRFDSCFRMAKYFLCGEPSLPVLGKAVVKDGVASVDIKNEGKGIIQSMFCYTTDKADVRFRDRKWKSIPVERKGNTLSVKLPEGIFQGYFSVYDQKSRFKDCCGSSNVLFFGDEK